MSAVPFGAAMTETNYETALSDFNGTNLHMETDDLSPTTRQLNNFESRMFNLASFTKDIPATLEKIPEAELPSDVEASTSHVFPFGVVAKVKSTSSAALKTTDGVDVMKERLIRPDDYQVETDKLYKRLKLFKDHDSFLAVTVI
ncbi:unnamed protein product [Peronospora belbahrii]|uniref:Uncharacterized protein n=1 Tax=Peronospora belbahrii TaxID=622444 RepID=A0ABN8DFG2_9STRA|nr:unnamed protein product [Peronospora belbahrii]